MSSISSELTLHRQRQDALLLTLLLNLGILDVLQADYGSEQSLGDSVTDLLDSYLRVSYDIELYHHLNQGIKTASSMISN